MTAIDPQRIIGSVTDFDIILIARLDVGSDPAEPQQVYLSC